MKIPTYEEASERVVSGTSSHLDWFIVENEPGGLGTERFRRELSNAIDEVVKEVNESGKGATIRITTERYDVLEKGLLYSDNPFVYAFRIIAAVVLATIMFLYWIWLLFSIRAFF